MTTGIPHEWLFPDTLTEAAAIQRELAQRVSVEDDLPPAIRIVAGTDVSNNLRDPENLIYAAVASLSYPDLKPLEQTCVKAPAAFDYVPGFLAFREVPALVEAYQQLSIKPDLLFVDGHGISHPRRLGIASHLGVILDCPTIGVAKSILVGKPEGTLGNHTGDTIPLVWKGQVIGAVLRTRPNVQPVYVASGHKISLESAILWVTRCLTRYRLPESTRQAHAAANTCRKALGIPAGETGKRQQLSLLPLE
jgi:deoxyribonuclease V